MLTDITRSTKDNISRFIVFQSVVFFMSAISRASLVLFPLDCSIIKIIQHEILVKRRKL